MSDVVRTIDGKPVVFRRMKMKENIALTKLAYEARRSALLKERQGGEDVAAALEALRPFYGDPTLLWRWCWTLEGAEIIVEKSLPGFDLEGIGEPFQIGLLAAELCGFDTSEVRKIAKGKPPVKPEDETNPTSQPSGTT